MYFSSTKVSNQLRTDIERACLPNLYKGTGGHILNLSVTRAEPGAGPSEDIVEQRVQQTIEEVVAPAYTKDGSPRSPAQVITHSGTLSTLPLTSPFPLGH